MYGKGSYSIIKIYNDNKTLIEKKFTNGLFHFTSLREIGIYKYFEYNNIDAFLKIRGINYNGIVLDRYRKTLQDLNTQHMLIEDKINIIFSLIKLVKILHDNNITHRDIKPENILWNNINDIKIIDFGISQLGNYNKKICNELNMNVYTKYWQPPEIYDKKIYTNKADIWALGIVFVRILIYISDENIFNIINGFKINDKTKIFEEYKDYLIDKIKNSRPDEPDRFKDLFINDLLLDLIMNMLLPDQELRYDINDCINHPLFNERPLAPLAQLAQPDKYKLVYIQSQERIKCLNYILTLCDEYNLSNYTLLYSYIIYDRLYSLKKGEFDMEFNYIIICKSCIYIAISICDIYDISLTHFKNIDYCLTNILTILNYNIYYYSPLDYLMEIENKNSNIIRISSNIIQDYIDMKYDNIKDLVINNI